MIFKKTISILLILLLVFSITGCTKSNKDMKQVDIEGYVTDASGVQHKIPDKEIITIASAYAVAVPFIVALNLSDNVVAINYKSIFWADNVDSLAKAGSIGRGVLDLELTAKFSPDVIIHRANDPKTVEAVKEKLDIPVIAIAAETVDEVYSTLDLIGRYCHAEHRAQEVKDWMIGKFSMIEELVSSIPDDEKLTALVFGGQIGIVAGGDMLQSWMLEHAGAICLAKEVTSNIDGDKASAWANIGTEAIFDMNPDVIFCTSSTVLGYTTDQLMSDSSWSSMQAVKDERIYQIPAKIDSWDLPGISSVIGTMWMLHTMYPNLMSSEQLQAEIDEYYMFMFSKTFEQDYLGYSV